MVKFHVILLLLVSLSYAMAAPTTDCTESGTGCRKLLKKGLTDTRDLTSWNLKFGKLAIAKSTATSTLSKAGAGIIDKLIGAKHDDTSAMASRTNVQYGPLDVRHTQMTNTFYRP